MKVSHVFASRHFVKCVTRTIMVNNERQYSDITSKSAKSKCYAGPLKGTLKYFK
jgi:hypothetical protein